jgi:hypothetical protein
VRDLDELRQLRQRRRNRINSPARDDRHPRPSHCSYEAATGPHRQRQPELRGERPRQRRCAIILDSRWPDELEADANDPAAGSGADERGRRGSSSAGFSSWSYLPDLSAVSSPNHFAARARQVQPTFTREPCSRRPSAARRRVDPLHASLSAIMH